MTLRSLSRRKLLLLGVAGVFLVILCLLFLYRRTFTGSKFVPDSRYGSTFGILVYEQTGNAASNLMNLQCWAGSLKMKVVEPSIRETKMIADDVFQFSKDSSGERFRDLFDIEHWNSYGRKKNYAPLVSMEDFLENASKNIIYVEVMYSGYLKCPQGTFHYISNGVAAPLQFLRRLGLSVSYPNSFLSSHGFKIVRTVCIDLLQEGRLRTQREFNELLFGDLLGKGNFTVVFDEWRAMRNELEHDGSMDSVDPNSDLHRILIKDTKCTYKCINSQPYHLAWDPIPSQKVTSHKSTPVVNIDTAVLKTGLLALVPSSQVLAHAAKYRAKYLNNKPYVAIMMRMENLQYGITTESSYTSCLNTAKNLWTTATQKYGISQTFITSDAGKYGSYSWSPNQASIQFQDDIIRMAGMPSSFVDTLDTNIEEVTGSTGRVNIAWTESIIVAEARCIIFLGGGAFQGIVLNLHSALYLGTECFVFLDTYCKEHAKLGF